MKPKKTLRNKHANRLRYKVSQSSLYLCLTKKRNMNARQKTTQQQTNDSKTHFFTMNVLFLKIELRFFPVLIFQQSIGKRLA